MRPSNRRARISWPLAFAAASLVWASPAHALVDEGTRVAISDDSTRNVDELILGDDVLTLDAAWTPSSVTDVFQGVETHPVYYLEYQLAGDDHEFVIATADQPFVTKTGLIPARNLRTGDVLQTYDGEALITAVSAGALNSRVFGLNVSDPMSASVDTPEGHIVLMNGVQVADAALERALQQAHEDQATSLLEQRLPSGWAADYENRSRHQYVSSVRRERLESVLPPSRLSHRARTDAVEHLSCLERQARRLEARTPTGPWQGVLPTEACTRPVSLTLRDVARADEDGHIHLTMTCPHGYRVTDVRPRAGNDAEDFSTHRLSARTVHVGASGAKPRASLRATATCR